MAVNYKLLFRQLHRSTCGKIQFIERHVAVLSIHSFFSRITNTSYRPTVHPAPSVVKSSRHINRSSHKMTDDDVVRTCSYDTCPSTNLKDTVSCFVCKLIFHTKCYGLSASSLKGVGGDCNLQFVCDSCVADFKPVCPTHITNIHAEISSIKTMLLAIRKNLPVASTETSAVPDTATLLANIHDMIKEKNVTPLQTDETFKSELKSMLTDIRTAIPSQLEPIASAATPQVSQNGQNGQPKRNDRRRAAPNVDHLNRRNSERNVGAALSPASSTHNQHNQRSRPTSQLITKSVVVSHLHPSTTEAQLISYATTKLGLTDDVPGLVAKALIPRNRSPNQLNFVSIKVDLPARLYDRFTAAAIWPEKVTVHDFENRPSKSPATGAFLV